MRIGINALGLLPGVIGGVETYLRGLIGGLSRLSGDHQFVLFTNRENHSTFSRLGPNFRRVQCNFSARWSVASMALTRVVGEQIYLPWRAARERLDVIHSPLDTTPLFSPCPTVMTLHDMNFDALPEARHRYQRSIARALVTLSAHRAQAIITVSEFSRREIIASLRLPRDRIFAIHNGVAGPEDQMSSNGRDSDFAIAIESPYLVAFSSVHPHKNIDALLRVFAQLDTAKGYKLVVIGHPPLSGDNLPALARHLGIRDRVIFTGYVSEATKYRLLRGARMLAFPSRYEGFGLPVIEAMRAGIPVACAARGALPEIAGQAARMFNPDDPVDFAAALREVLCDEALRARLVAAGNLNVQRFSWDRAARKTMQVYQRVAHPAAVPVRLFSHGSATNDSAVEPADSTRKRRA